MIRINLLPAAQRRGTRISPKVLGTSFGSALAVAASVGWFGLVYFGQLAECEAEHARVTAKLQEKQPQAAYFDKLDSNRQDYSARVQTIQDIGKSRRVWSRFMDELIDVVNNSGDVDRHLAWFDALQLKSDAKTKSAVVTLPGFVQGTSFDKVANLHRDLEQAPFARDLASKSAPGGKQEPSKDRIPPEAFKTTIELRFKPTVQEPPKAPPKPPTQPQATPPNTAASK